MKIIDAHMHVSLNGFTSERLIQYLNKQGIDKCWLLSWEELNPSVTYIYQHLPLDEILDAYDKYPDRIVPFYAPDPVDKDFERKLTRAIGSGIKGCGELKVSCRWEDSIIESYLKIVESFNIPLLFHMEVPRIHYVPDDKSFINRLFERLLNDKYNGVSRYYLNGFIDSSGIFKRKVKSNRVQFPGYLFDFDYLERRVQQFPGINFIGHGPDFWNAISVASNPKYIHQQGKIGEFGIIDRLLEEYDNFYCDISGTSGFNALTRDRAAAKIFVEKHAGKLLFGTDNTNFGLLELLQSIVSSQNDLNRILHKNAEGLIND